MATYFVSPSGSNANNGLGPDASAATNKPWLTLGKALITGSPVVAGDTIYVAPGYYYSTATIAPLATISSSGTPTKIIGDPTNKQGFKDGSGVLLAQGLPWITTRTAVEGLDAQPASNSDMFASSTNNPSGLQFSFLVFETKYNGWIWTPSLGAGTDNSFTDCVFFAASACAIGSGTPTAGRNITFRRCIGFTQEFIGSSNATAAATADADLNILVEECMIFGRPMSTMTLGTSGGNKAGGIRYKNCTVVGDGGGSRMWDSTASVVSTVTPITVTGCLIIVPNSDTFRAGTSGQIVDGGYNRIICTNSSNGSAANQFSLVTQAGTSFINPAPNLVLPHLVTWGLDLPRHDFLGWTDAAMTTQRFSASGLTSSDFRGRSARPWGAGSSIGCWQAQAVAQDATSALTGGGVNSLKLTGAGEVSLFVPVDSGIAVTFSVITKSSSYGGTIYPSLIAVANGNVGLAADIVVSATSASEQTVQTSSFTPTAAGVIELRLVSSSTSTTSATYFDILAVP